MSRIASSQLAGAIAERVLSLSRVQDRLRALETYAPSGEAEQDGQAAAEAVLRRALAALSSREGYELAGRLLVSEDAIAARSLESSVILQDLSQAGLAVWDVGLGSSQPTLLLRELFRLLEAAVTEAAAELKAER
ncbi:MAG: hypothetical protein ACYDAL_11325 [Candidatus Dormibacteraceae bacterium]